MSDTFYIKRGDTRASLLYELFPESTDLTGATVRFSMRPLNGVAVIDRAAAAIVTPTGTPSVRYDWQPGDTATAGAFEAEFEVTYADGGVQTFPNVGFIPVRIGADVS